MASGFWLAAPSTGVYNDPNNWQGNFLPGVGDTAVFGTSSIQSIGFSQPLTSVGAWYLGVGGYVFTVGNSQSLAFVVDGITGASLGSALSVTGNLYFLNQSTAGAINIFNTGLVDFSQAASAGTSMIDNGGTVGFRGESTAASSVIENSDFLDFYQASSAGDATITNTATVWFEAQSNAGSASIENEALGITEFHDTASAGTALIYGDGRTKFWNESTAGDAELLVKGSSSYVPLEFLDSTSAGTSTITVTAAVDWFPGVAFRYNSTAHAAQINILGGLAGFTDNATAASATITNHSSLFFYLTSSAGNATITNYGHTRFIGSSNAANATIVNINSGSVDFSVSNGVNGDGRLTAGAIGGSGTFSLGNNQLTVGGNNLTTFVTGSIQDGGVAGAQSGASLVKVGSGTLALAGVNTYTGGTAINGGSVQVDGSVMGGVVIASGTRLSGNGTIGGSVIAHAGGSVAPGSNIGALKINGDVSLAAGATLSSYIGGALAGVQHDVLVVSGTVSLGNSKLALAMDAAYQPNLSSRQNFQLVDNAGTDAVIGQFTGLGEGAAIFIGDRVFTISYRGGSGNDVVLTSEGVVILGTEGKDTANTSTAPMSQTPATALADKILGLAGNDKLTSAGGDDTVQGGLGKDTIDGGAGKDIADYSDKTKSVEVTLKGSGTAIVKVGGKNEDSIKNIENLTGGSKGDKLTGDSKDNRLDGGAGKDALKGAAGKDQFVFKLMGPANADKIADFKHKTDKIVLEDSIFAALGATLDKDEFYAKAGATKAADATDRIVYNKTNGNLYYDADGVGGAKAVLFATLSSKPGNFDHTDFIIV